ncbi:MAG TPA: FHA domain-containing protein, partial [Planctomycetota bacterium]|nr:FHA domain-containing protein [Planctomycetota bacterium]
MFILQVRNEILEDQQLPLPSSAVIVGRGDDADVKIVDQSVSRFHARLEVATHDQLLITDLGSSNGTFLNDTRLAQPSLAREGDTIRFGTVTCNLIHERHV